MHRGVAYWRNGDDERIVILTAFAQMIALDAKTGKPVPSFGTDGRIDLTEGLRRPVDRNYYTMSLAAGDRAWRHRGRLVGDGLVGGEAVAAGRRATASTSASGRPAVGPSIPSPQGEEPGAETRQKESWKEAGNANVWAPMSADEELGYVYLPVSTPTNDYYGGHRPGDGLYGEGLGLPRGRHRQEGLALPARASRPVGLRPAGRAVTSIDIKVDGKPIKAVAQVTKQAFVYVFDRVTGKPVWPIEEQPVPASSVPGESASKTQPIPERAGTVRHSGRAR